jgi:hypothetical protein
MLPFQYHFSAYPYQVEDILRSTLLRDALTAPANPASDAKFLRSLEV